MNHPFLNPTSQGRLGGLMVFTSACRRIQTFEQPFYMTEQTYRSSNHHMFLLHYMSSTPIAISCHLLPTPNHHIHQHRLQLH
jgi:hypothetical protein